MKYIVELKYTNPAHEHVSLRRRVETVTRLVEAANEDQAILRAANQQRALGFMIKEAKVVKEKSHDKEDAEETVVSKGKEVMKKAEDEDEKDEEKDEDIEEDKGVASYPLVKKGEKLKPMKLKEGFDPEPSDIAAHLVKKHGKGKVTMDHVDAYERDRDSNRAIDKEAVMKHVQKMSEEVEQVDEAGKGYGSGWMLKHPDGKTLDAKLKAKKELETKRQKAYGDPNAGVSVKKEEVEQIDEVKTANPGRGYHGEHPADKADAKYAEMHAKLLKTAVAGNSSSKKIRNYLDSTHGRHLAGHENDSEYIAKDFAKFDRSYKPEMFKEEQIDELKKSTLASYVKKATRDVASASRLQRGYETDAARSEFAPVRRGSELAAKNMRKFAGKRSRGIAKAVDKLTKEEVVTEAEREAGYKMPAHVAAGQKKFDAQAKDQNKPRPQAGTLAAKKIKEAAEKMVKKVRAMKDDKNSTKAAEIKLDNEKKKVNKINMEPSVEVKG